MKKKVLSIILVVCLLATALVSGTLAYFTDDDGVRNVMTTGNVSIVQNEQERGDNGLQNFTQKQKLYPYTGSVDANGMANEYGESLLIGEKERQMFDQDKNAIDKIVTVTNNGSEECYVRTLFAWEMYPVKDENGDVTAWESPFLHGLVTSAVKSASGSAMPAWKNDDGTYVTFEMDNKMYMVTHYYYEGILSEDETTRPSLKQMYLKSTVDNEWYEAVGEEYEVLVLSQATQVQGFAADPETFVYAEAKTALETAFGKHYEVGAEKLVEWFSVCK